MKAAVKKRTGIPASKQFICATHTHSAPSCMGALGTSVDPRYPLLLKRKITEAMRLVAAAKVRKAQDAVIGARPFSESLVKVLFAINSRLAGEDVDVPLTKMRPVKTAMLVVCTGDRGLCGGFNNFIIRKTEQRVAATRAAPPLPPRPRRTPTHASPCAANSSCS